MKKYAVNLSTLHPTWYMIHKCMTYSKAIYPNYLTSPIPMPFGKGLPPIIDIFLNKCHNSSSCPGPHPIYCHSFSIADMLFGLPAWLTQCDQTKVIMTCFADK